MFDSCEILKRKSFNDNLNNKVAIVKDFWIQYDKYSFPNFPIEITNNKTTL
jgi:hypothetical protein